jgi:hypothetical protein
MWVQEANQYGLSPSFSRIEMSVTTRSIFSLSALRRGTAVFALQLELGDLEVHCGIFVLQYLLDGDVMPTDRPWPWPSNGTLSITPR